MNFKQDENHEQLQEMYREFAENEVKPIAAEIDERKVSNRNCRENG